MNLETKRSTPTVNDGLVMVTYLIYALHGFSAVTGILSPAFVVTTFLTGWPSIIAVIINYVKRGDTRGTYLESHFRWQIRTFCFALLWVLVALMVAFTVVGFPFAIVLAWGTGLWVLYRIMRGWLRLVDDRPMPL